MRRNLKPKASFLKISIDEYVIQVSHPVFVIALLLVWILDVTSNFRFQAASVLDLLLNWGAKLESVNTE
jgi:hypothetical protein